MPGIDGIDKTIDHIAERYISRQGQITAKLEPKFKTKWLAALRSGRYKQTTGVLRSKKNGKIGYCCLGVACNLKSARHGWEAEDTAQTETTHNYRWFDVSPDTTDLAWLQDKTAGNILAAANDELFSFEEIADWIEENL